MSPRESTRNDRVICLIREGVKKEGVRGLARSTGLSPAIISRYMHGMVGEPSLSTLNKLAKYFGDTVSVDTTAMASTLRSYMNSGCSTEKAGYSHRGIKIPNQLALMFGQHFLSFCIDYIGTDEDNNSLKNFAVKAKKLLNDLEKYGGVPKIDDFYLFLIAAFKIDKQSPLDDYLIEWKKEMEAQGVEFEEHTKMK